MIFLAGLRRSAILADSWRLTRQICRGWRCHWHSRLDGLARLAGSGAWRWRRSVWICRWFRLEGIFGPVEGAWQKSGLFCRHQRLGDLGQFWLGGLFGNVTMISNQLWRASGFRGVTATHGPSGRVVKHRLVLLLLLLLLLCQQHLLLLAVGSARSTWPLTVNWQALEIDVAIASLVDWRQFVLNRISAWFWGA